MPDEVAERGRGLAMAQAALRLLAYFRDELGNHWRLVSKAFPGSGRPE
jgi:serine/threonine-protein kinase RsbW